MEKLNREQALALLKKYNKEAFHLRHALTVEGVMKHYAATHGYEEDAAAICAAILACSVSYEVLAKRMISARPACISDPLYGEWISGYASDAYAAESRELEDFTNRLTAGVGVNFDKLSIDLAYQYSITKGEFSPFMSYYAEAGSDLTDNLSNIVDVDNKRHQLMLTLGYHF